MSTGSDVTPAAPPRANWAEQAVADHAGAEHLTREEQVLERIEKARRRKAKIKEERITLSHGAGGKATHTLIDAVFLDAFRNPLLEQLEDGASLTVGIVPAGVHDRLVRGAPAVLPRRGHRRPGRQRHGQRPGDVRRAAAVPVLRLHPRGGLPGRRPAADRGLDGARRPRRPGCRSSPATPRSSSAARPTGCTSTPPASGCSTAPVSLSRVERTARRQGDRVRPDRRPRHHRDAGPRRAGHRGGHRVRHRPDARAGRRPAGRAATWATGCGCCGTPPAVAWPPSCNEVAVASQVAVVVDEAVGAGPPGGQRRVRAAGHRPAVRGLRGSAGRGRRRRRTPTPRSRRCGPGRSARVPR